MEDEIRRLRATLARRESGRGRRFAPELRQSRCWTRRCWCCPGSREPTPKPHGRSIFSSPWFWGATTIVVLGVAAGGYYEFTTRDPIRGTLGPGVISAP